MNVKKIVAAALILALQMAIGPAFASPATASLTGRVLVGASQTPLAGARVHVGDPATGKIYTSQPAAADGTFTVAGLPAATYQVAVEAQGGLFVVGNTVPLAAGQDRAVQLAVNRQTEPTEPAEPKEDDTGKPAATGFWNNPLTASLIVVGSAIVVGLIVSESSDDDPTSPFTAD